MPLPPGTRLGPYEIVAPLGAGGMGEVYRATDTSLGREVAVKVLPEAFAQDPERLARFEREARTLASLNHPNIAAIYGFERGPAPDSAQGREAAGDGPAKAGHYIGTDVASGFSRTIAIVMELVEGEDLSQVIARSRIALDEALPIAKQIAAALEGAHEQGIVHRDLKPANVKVTPDGHVKVLDFGLAKAMDQGSGIGDRGSGGSGHENSPTITTPAMTQAGMILGTAAYMSPEQAKGRATDKRSDVWAYGCVLYEMLSGRRAFAGEDVSDTLASILKSDPDWTMLPADTPPAIRTLIERCLIKDRRQRIADLSVASFVLAEARALDTPGTPSAPAQAESRAPGRQWLAPLAAGIGASALVALGAWSMWPKPTARPVARFSVTLADDERFTSGTHQLVALSPDGQRMAWAGLGRILVRSVSEFDAHAMAGIETASPLSANNPVFSPDGESLVFYSAEDRALRRVALSGGAPVMICAMADSPRGMSWDSSGIVFGQAGGIFRCNANGGQPEQLATVESDEQVYGPQILPGGRSLLFTIRDGDSAIFAQRIDGTGVERLTKPGEGETHVPESWSPDGRHLSFAVLTKGREFTLWTLSLADGTVTRFRDVLSTDPIGSVFSPDGHWIAYHTLPPGAPPTSGNSGAFVEPFPPTGALYQAPRVLRDFHPVWSRDGAELFYVGSTTSVQAAAVPVTTQSGITFGPVATFPFVVTAGRLSSSPRAFDVLPNNTFVGVVAESASERALANNEIRVVLNWYEELKRMVPHR